MARGGTLNIEFVGVAKNSIVTVRREVHQANAIACANGLTVKHIVLRCGAHHVTNWRNPSDNFIGPFVPQFWLGH